MTRPTMLLLPLCLLAALGSGGLHAQAAQTQGQAVNQSVDPAAAPPPMIDPRALSDAERRAYATTLREARGLIDKKQYDAAITEIDRLVAAHPREPQARFMKGVALTEAGRRDAAMVAYRAILEDFPELPEPRNNLAALYAQEGNYDAARTELEIALKSAPDYAVAHENLADVYARLAAVHYEQAATLDKRNRTAPAKLKLVRDVTAATP